VLRLRGFPGGHTRLRGEAGSGLEGPVAIAETPKGTEALAGLEELAELDPRIARLIDEVDVAVVTERRSSRSADRFQALARIIVGQQVSTAAARTVWKRIEDEFGGTVAPIDLIAPGAEDRLRKCGLSGRKAAYMIGIAEAIESGELRPDELDELTDAEVIEALVALKGIGHWSAEMFLIFDLGRTDVFSGGDLRLRRGIQIVYELDEPPTPEEAVAIAASWSPHRTLASLYLWEAVHANPGA
jgi:DNA-3-methyladenine glycosylase II